MRIGVGGVAHGCGKTALVCAMLRAFRERDWAAVKITTHNHPVSGALQDAHGVSLRKQTLADASDTGRFLSAGAAHAYLLTIPEDSGRLELPPPVDHHQNVMVESTRAWQLADLSAFLMVANGSPLKATAMEAMSRCAAVIWTGAGEPDALVCRVPVFRASPPDYPCAALLAFLNGALGLESA